MDAFGSVRRVYMQHANPPAVVWEMHAETEDRVGERTPEGNILDLVPVGDNRKSGCTGHC